MKTLGLIGGTSWHATQEYYKLIQEGYAEKTGGLSSPRLIIYSIDISVMRTQDEEKITAVYSDVSHILQDAGAEAIVICANTPHLVYDQIAASLDIPFLHIAEATGKEAKRLGFRKLGLLGTRPTMNGKFISGYLEKNFGMEVLIPEADNFDKTHDYIADELTRGIFSEAARGFYLEEIGRMESRGADGIILGCTELPILFKNTKTNLPLLSTTDLHAAMAVEFILGGTKTFE